MTRLLQAGAVTMLAFVALVPVLDYAVHGRDGLPVLPWAANAGAEPSPCGTGAPSCPVPAAPVKPRPSVQSSPTTDHPDRDGDDDEDGENEKDRRGKKDKDSGRGRD